ncbi:ornithine cyclodeaminase family protein [Acidianus sulfidivorans JP7]|uniref:Ornithine cyclodeaminase n=1 Tax=Acidianus sulfidivorans JP7 TaxID=619593 RepID=A0A2U9INU3_9CREN|nr:ornithine cyclodeaminase family protein [Acidianus sulfidivorans]AWR97683.1 ornithine cyclodeaminase family protein [Acidianus sulfidivorans JP7]
MIFLDAKNLEELLSPKNAVEAVKEAFTLFYQGKISQPQRQVLTIKGNWWGIMPSFTDFSVVVKIVNVINDNPSRGLPSVQGVVVLMSPDNGEILAIMDGTVLTAIRTASASVLSTELAYGSKIDTLGIIGAGMEAYYHAKIAQGYLSVSRILISARKSHVELAKRINAEAVDLEKLLKESDVIYATTSSKTPVVKGMLMKDDFHVSSIGAHTPDSREIDDDTIRKTKTFIVDSLEAVSKESGDFIQPNSSGLLNNVKIVEIGKILVEGIKIQRPSIFKTVGISAQDNITAYYAYKLSQTSSK